VELCSRYCYVFSVFCAYKEKNYSNIVNNNSDCSGTFSVLVSQCWVEIFNHYDKNECCTSESKMFVLKTDGDAAADNLLRTPSTRRRQVERCVETGRWCEVIRLASVLVLPVQLSSFHDPFLFTLIYRVWQKSSPLTFFLQFSQQPHGI